MLRKLFPFVILFAPLLTFGQNNCSGNLTLGPCSVTTVGVTVALSPASVAVGQTSIPSAQLVLSGNLPNANVTNQCAPWTSDNLAVATIGTATINNSVVTVVNGVAAGTANISCTVGAIGTNPGLTGSSPITVAAPPIITNPVCGTPPCVLPAATQGVAYSFPFQASGGVTPYTWSSSVGAPPTGLAFSATGCTAAQGNCNLSGTPTGTGTTTWTVQVSDSIAELKTVQVSLTVNASAACGTGNPVNFYCARQDTNSTAGNGGPIPNTAPTNLMGLNCATPGACGTVDCALDTNNVGPASAYVCRVTDFTMVGSGNFVTDFSSSTTRQWNSDSTIYGAVYKSNLALFKWTDGTPPTIVPKGNVPQDVAGVQIGSNINWSGQPCSVATCGTSAATSYLFYTTGASAGFPTRNVLLSCVLDTTNAAWTASTGLNQNLAAAVTCTSLFDPITATGLTAYMTGQDGAYWNRWMAAGSADGNADKVDGYSCGGYRYAQDAGSLIVCFNRSTNAYQWIDLKTAQTCGSAGMPCGTITGYGPLPPPTDQTFTWNTTGGTIPCSNNTTYVMATTYTVLGSNGSGGESTAHFTNVPATGGSGSTCSITVTPPSANPGGGTGINGPLTATGYNVYFVCSYLSGGANCAFPTPPAANMVPATGAPAQPVISSITTCNTGSASNTVTYWVVIRSGSGSTSASSVPSLPQSLTVTSNTAPGCTITLTSPVPTGMTADVLRDDLSIRGCTIAAGGTSCRDNTQSPLPYAVQTNTIAGGVTIPSVAVTSVDIPKINAAAPLIHNFRFDESGSEVQIELTDAYQSSQNAAPKANTQLYWQLGTANVIAAQQNVQTCNTTGSYAGIVSYASGHWTNGYHYSVSWPGSTGRAEGIVTPFANTCAGMNGAQFFLNAANKGLDTQSGDQHLNHSNSINATPDTPIFRDAYPLINPYVLPTVPYDGEITAWQLPISITSVSRASNVVTVVTNGSHGLQNGANVTLNGVTDTTFNGAGTGISVTNATTFTFAQTGANATSSGGSVDRPMARFMWTWDSGASKNGTGSTFNGTPRGGVSQDGKKFCFISDMQRNGSGLQGTASVGLGSSTGATTCTAASCRWDLYCGQVK